MPNLTSQELVDLVRSVFPRLPGDSILSLLVDVPRHTSLDNPAWRHRRAMAFEWLAALYDKRLEIPLDDIRLYAYADVGSNNADLPPDAYLLGTLPPEDASTLGQCGLRVPFEDVLAESQIIIAPTEYSTTAPLKVAAKKYGFRAATMPGFSAAMIPALRIDYGEVARRVEDMKERLDKASGADILFRVDNNLEYRMHFDLRNRTAHASTGRFPDPATAGNLPSGEAYIVPYEGEQGPASRTRGELPVEFLGEVLVFAVEANRAQAVRPAATLGPAWKDEAEHLRREPAYGNMAELGFGVLGDFGVSPVGEILLDEKLGLHVAFGRSDHFGGRVGPADFSSPAEVVHLDRIYIPATQPRVSVFSVVFRYPDGTEEVVMTEGRYRVF